VYVNRDGQVVRASARLTAGSTLIWGTPRVALRLEGGFSKAAALAIAASAR
jgi:cytochrome c-type biogenesis protein CcmH/NrfF